MRRNAIGTETGDRARANALLRIFVPLLAILFNLVAAPVHATDERAHQQLCETVSTGGAAADADSASNATHGAPAHASHCDACPLFAPALKPESARIAERSSFEISPRPIRRYRERAEISCPASHRSRAPPPLS